MDGFRHLIAPEGRTYVVGSFAPVLSQTVAPHTLILGTMPSNASHAHAQYYAHPSNAFWWIVGEALGFRRGGHKGGERDWPLEQFSMKPSKDIIEALEKVESPILDYNHQLETLTAAGFALWDVVGRCTIRNSEDSSIRDKQPNDVRGLLSALPSIKRIVFSSGATSARLFLSLNRAWLKEGGEFWVGVGRHSEAVFGKVIGEGGRKGKVELVVPVSVSPAAAGVRFPEKREEWLRDVFQIVTSSQYCQIVTSQYWM